MPKYYKRPGYIVGVLGRSKRKFFIDNEDYEKVKNFRWRFDKDGYIVSDSEGRHVKMHRLLICAYDLEDNLDVDHINGIRHDNRKCNLRLCKRSDNCHNRRLMKNNTSGHTGVFKIEENKWKASIMVEGKTISLGVFTNKSDAVLVRKKAEKEHFKDFALKDSRINIQDIIDSIIGA